MQKGRRFTVRLTGFNRPPFAERSFCEKDKSYGDNWKGWKGKMVRCDKAMRRSKEKPVPYIGEPWRCTGQCKTCVCGLHQNDDGTWSHTPYRKDGRETECRL